MADPTGDPAQEFGWGVEDVITYLGGVKRFHLGRSGILSNPPIDLLVALVSNVPWSRGLDVSPRRR